METLTPILIGFSFVVFIVLVFVYALPAKTVKEKRKKEKLDLPQNPQSKDWEEVAHRLEKHIYSLRGEINRLTQQERNYQKQIELFKAKNEKLTEKLGQHEDWLAKEQASKEKIEKEHQQMKTSLLKTETDREREYQSRVKFERDYTEIKREADILKETRKDLSMRATELEAQLKGYKEEFLRQKKINEELTKKNDEMSWVSQSEYEKLEKMLADKEKEIERMRREYTQS